jgi:hypothetical protein
MIVGPNDGGLKFNSVMRFFTDSFFMPLWQICTNKYNITRKAPKLVATWNWSRIYSTGDTTIMLTSSGSLEGSINQLITDLVIGKPITIPNMKIPTMNLIRDIRKFLASLII